MLTWVCFVGKRTLTGSAKQQAHGRDALKANRKAKEERRAHHVRPSHSNYFSAHSRLLIQTTDASPSKSHRRGSASSDMDTSSSEDERERERDTAGGGIDSKRRDTKDSRETKGKVEEKLTVNELGRIQLTRTQLSKECMKPWFDDYVKGEFGLLLSV